MDALSPTSIVRVLADPGKARKIKGVETLDGRGYWRERIGEAEFSTQAPSFFQVNTAQAGKLIDIVEWEAYNGKPSTLGHQKGWTNVKVTSVVNFGQAGL